PEIRTRLHAEARRQARPFVIALAAAIVAVVAGLAGWGPVAVVMHAAPVWPLFFGILAAWTGARLYEAHRTARLTPDGFRAEVDDALHGSWLRRQRAPATTVLRYTFLGIGAAQLLASSQHDPVLAAALVKDAVRAGELWRLLTAGYLHADPLHFALNFGALLWLGQLVETHANRAALGLVFLLTILTGNVASVVLMPTVNALGASTGLMGLIGFLAVVGWRRRERVPAGLLRTILVNVAIIGSIGVIGSGVVDNAGHFGGLIGGLLLGLLITPAVRPDDGVGWAPSRILQVTGTASLAILVAGAAATSLYLFAGPY
ncbi:MAG TPA: rhomboid family intramembrane serine protease, partial [Longimicrobiaceae bacterium]|nr:rhomboid family intramembrane serine protease [Longimicrobiaceae bacterium]